MTSASAARASCAAAARTTRWPSSPRGSRWPRPSRASPARRSLPVAPRGRVDLSHAAGVLRLLEVQLWLRVDAFHAAIRLHPPDAVPEAGAGAGLTLAGTRERDVEAVREL